MYYHTTYSSTDMCPRLQDLVNANKTSSSLPQILESHALKFSSKRLTRVSQ